ncbi:hypothetical protein AnaeK_2889 [Anaeromyxobacter sp. K]|uniref:hypothetical protein n=1 Tax=Anaeromyxobacter sp. (strain K) TaxID=447217 RepID=UPI00015F856D|nr:hypothetical protein [Anaeromyxobacter sp. K]ACG74113.1 hypothetical protein AnaeK_2889 [Anaeromyxobacter sp. K]
MKHTLTSGPAPLTFHVRSRLGLLWDLAMVGVWIAMLFAFMVQVWSAPTPRVLRTLGATSITAHAA